MIGVRKNRQSEVSRVTIAYVWLVRALAAALGALLIRSSIFHVENGYAFLSAIYSYRLLPFSIGLLLAALLPSLQMALGITFFFLPKAWHTAFTSAAMLFLLYASAQTITYMRGLNITCGCFGPSADNPIGFWSIGLAWLCFSFSTAGALLVRQCHASTTV